MLRQRKPGRSGPVTAPRLTSRSLLLVCLAVFSAASSLWTLRRALLVDHRRDTLPGSRAALRSLAPNTCEATALIGTGAVPCLLTRSPPQTMHSDLN